MSENREPLLSICVEDFRLLQQMVWTGDIEAAKLSAGGVVSLHRLLDEQLVRERGGRLFSSERGKRAVFAHRYHETEQVIVVLRRDVDDP